MVLANQKSYTEAPMKQKRLTKKPRNNLSFLVLEKKKATKGGSKKRDTDLHKLIFMPNGLPDGTDLAYYAKGKLSPSQFETHVGWSAKRQSYVTIESKLLFLHSTVADKFLPSSYRHIYTSSGVTLHDIALMLANGQSLFTSDRDDMCAVCGDGGKLIICNGCPRAFQTGDFVPLIQLLSLIVIITSLWPNEFHHNICPDGEGCSQEQFGFPCYY